MQISTEQRSKLTSLLSDGFAKASGYSATDNDVKRWDVVADAIIRSIEGIVETMLQDEDENAS